MKYIQKEINTITSLVKNYPKSTIAITTSVLCLSLLRKLHYKLVVLPGIVASIQILEGATTIRIKKGTAIPARGGC
jgi:hypothetical protein